MNNTITMKFQIYSLAYKVIALLFPFLIRCAVSASTLHDNLAVCVKSIVQTIVHKQLVLSCWEFYKLRISP